MTVTYFVSLALFPNELRTLICIQLGTRKLWSLPGWLFHAFSCVSKAPLMLQWGWFYFPLGSLYSISYKDVSENCRAKPAL